MDKKEVKAGRQKKAEYRKLNKAAGRAEKSDDTMMWHHIAKNRMREMRAGES